MSVKRVIVAGSRKYKNLKEATELLNAAFPPETKLEVVCGLARGADTLGMVWGLQRDFDIVPFPADWENLDVEGAVIRTRYDGKRYNAIAGHIRNEKMAAYAAEQDNGYLIAFWDGKSKGTQSMITLAKRYGLKVKVFIIDPTRPAPDPSYDEEFEVTVTLLEQKWRAEKSQETPHG